MSQLAELRKIIVGEQAEQLDSLKQRLDTIAIRSKDVASVLPEAIQIADQERNQDLTVSLEPVISNAVKTTIRKDPQGFADIFYPVLAPAIRLMIANSVRSFVESMNQSIESTTSVKGLKWRLESMRTGVPYSEIALRRALQYRVEQVFVIQSDTGLLIEHIVNENVQGLDSDAVSGMLTAIQSFVLDSFDAKSDEHLTNMHVGDLHVWLVHGPKALLACVIRGDAPNELRGQLIDVLDQVHIQHAEQIEDFNGEEKIPGIQEKIEPCLQLKLKDYDGQRKSMSWFAMLLLGCLVAGLLFWAYTSFEKNRMRNQASKVLAATPGVLATDVFWNDGQLNVVGLIDPIADLPWDGLEQIGLDRQKVLLEMKRFRSLEPSILAKRLSSRYDFPTGLLVELNESGEQTIALLSGVVPYADYRQVVSKTEQALDQDVEFDISGLRFNDGSIAGFIQQELGALPAGTAVQDAGGIINISGLMPVEWLQKIQSLLNRDKAITAIIADDLEIDLIQSLRSIRIKFAEGVSLQEGGVATLDRVAQMIRDLNYALSLHGQTLRLSLIGSTDGDNTTQYNKEMRGLRAKYVMDQLLSRDILRQLLVVEENRNLYGDQERVVKFRIALIDLPAKQ